MDELLETVTTAESSHEGFRVWITTEAHNQFPISLLQVRTALYAGLYHPVPHSVTNMPSAFVCCIQNNFFNIVNTVESRFVEPLRELREIEGLVLKGHCHEHNFKNSTAQKHVYTIGNLLTVLKFS